MAKFRFPGKALKLNTRKRVRYRGSYTANTPEELYTRRIRRGLDLFTQIFGESDEDEDGFEGFSSASHPEAQVVQITRTATPEPPVRRGGKRSAQKVEEACVVLESEGLVTRRRKSVVEMAVKELRASAEKNTDLSISVGRTDKEVGLVEPVCDSKAVDAAPPPSSLESDQLIEGTNTVVAPATNHVTRKQTNHRISRPPTVKTALAKKLLAKAKKKMPSLPVVGEKSPKRFILPTMSVRSSRIIKPNKRLFADITDICSTSSSLLTDVSTEAREGTISVPSKRLVKLTRKGRGSHTQFLSLPRSRAQSKNSLSGTESVGRDRMRRTISLYTASITGPSKGQVGRPPKRLLRRYEAPIQEIEAEVPDSPQRCDPKESRVKEKIEKLLRSPWDDRLKLSGKGEKAENDELMPAPATSTSPALSASVISRNILRKARLNLNKTTLQKIRDPASLQRLIPMCDEGSVEGKCAICDLIGGNTRMFGIVFCQVCSNFLHSASDGPREIFDCQGSKGECQFQGLVEEDRCPACWLSRILLSCSMPNLLHDRLRKRLPTILKEHIPTSLARCMNIGGLPAILEKDAELTSHTKRLPLDPGGGGAFGSVMDLPGGWRRKTGPEVIVISPCGEKFKSVQKLEEFLTKQGISTDARVLFGNNSPAVDRSTEVKSRSSVQSNSSARGKVVMTTLPGGWIRRIKWRSAGDRFDTYVCSPDGRTFRSRRELSAYFQLIGKVDDIHKYFPVVTGHSDASVPSSSDTPGSSSTEPVSSSEPCSEMSSDDKSPEASECETDVPKSPNRMSGSSNEKMLRFSHVKQLNGKNYNEPGRCRSKSMSKLKTADNSGEEPAGQVSSTDVSNEGNNLERKHKKAKMIMRSRSLSLGRKKHKGDTSLTDTTESESEQIKSGVSMMFPKAFSRSRSKSKPKSIVCLSLGENKSATLPETPVESMKELNDTDVPIENTDTVKTSPGRKSSVSAEDAPASATPSIETSEKKLDTKIVLKIPKKAIRPKGKRHKRRRKVIESDHTRLSVNDKQCSELQRVQEEMMQDTNQPVLAQIPSTNKSLDDAQGKLFNLDQEEDPLGDESEALVGCDMSIDSKVSSPNASEGEVVPDALLVPEIKAKSKKLSMYQTCHFGNGWSRKIRWNEKGEGKVALLHSPDSQTFRSRIELLAYFKKAGRSKVDLDFYFPPVLKREQPSLSLETNKVGKFPTIETAISVVTSTSAHSSEISEFSDSETLIKTSEDSCASAEESKRPRITRVIKCYQKSEAQSGLKSISENVTEEIITFSSPTVKISGSVPPHSEESRKHMVQPGKSGRKVIVVSTQEGKSSLKSEGEGTIGEAGGPRVKHVCRSQAQVLGIPRAVFPSPRKEEERLINPVIVPATKGNQKRKIITVTTTASGKVLRKTQWCNKCPGCTTPNCLKCSNCLDMKKYGGPGTKKKPCIMRKCHNPRLSAKSAISQESTSKVPLQVTLATLSSPTMAKEARKGPVVNIKVQEEKTEVPVVSSDSVSKSLPQEKGVFVPRQMTRTQPDQKDRGDIAAGKKFVPGALVNIDYWQGYDADEMMLTGYPVTTAAPLHPQVLCFRCGSVGKEQLLYCAWCCEGIHPYCLEDGEGPESEAEEMFWICRRCAVCQVCGAPGADTLLRCSDCRNYYHLECLGPSAHNTCQPTPDRPWEAESWALLGGSWPRQSAIYDVSECDLESIKEDVVMHTELDALKDAEEDVNEDDLVPDIFFLPVNDYEDFHKIRELGNSNGLDPDCIPDFEDLDDTICLEDSIIEVFRDTDLYKPEPSLTANPMGNEVVSMREDEYLYLRYKKEYEYPSNKIEISYFRLLQTIHHELFVTHGYPSWRELLNQGLVKERPCGSGSETETASEDESDSNESDFDWEDIFEIRRYEASQEMKERDDLRRERERKKREIEKEKARLERLKELEELAKSKELAKTKELAQIQANESSFITKIKAVGSEETISKENFMSKNKSLFKKKRKRGRPPGSVNKPKCGDEDFVILDDLPICDNVIKVENDDPVQKRKCKQPKSWEEFDRLFEALSYSYGGSSKNVEETSNGKVKSLKRKIIFSDNGVVHGKRSKLKIKPKKQKFKTNVDRDGNIINLIKNKKKVKVVDNKDKKAKRMADIRNKYISLKGKTKIKSSKLESKLGFKVSSVKDKKIEGLQVKAACKDLDVKATANSKVSDVSNKVRNNKKIIFTLRKNTHTKSFHIRESSITKSDAQIKEEASDVREETEPSSGLPSNTDEDWVGCIFSDHPVVRNSSAWKSYTVSDLPHNETAEASDDGPAAVMEHISEKMLKATDNCTDNFIKKKTNGTSFGNADDHNSSKEVSSINSCIGENKVVFERPVQTSPAEGANFSLELKAEALQDIEGEVKCRPEEENSDKENLPNVNSLAKIKENGLVSQRKIVSNGEEAGTSSVSADGDLTIISTSENISRKRQMEVPDDKTNELPEKRPRRSQGRASELASQRKAMMDF